MHDAVLGFVCFTAGVFFAIALGFIALGRMPLGGRREDTAGHSVSVDLLSTAGHTQPPRVEPQRRPWHGGESHPAWPECDCPSEAFHSKYYPAAGIQN